RVIDLSLVQHAAFDLGDARLLATHERVDTIENFARVIARNDRDALEVSDDDVARHHDSIPAGDRHVDFAGSIFVAPARAYRSAERGKPEGANAVDVANGAVDDDAAELLRGSRVAHELTEYRARRIATRAYHDDVARLGDLQRFVHHQV